MHIYLGVCILNRPMDVRESVPGGDARRGLEFMARENLMQHIVQVLPMQNSAPEQAMSIHGHILWMGLSASLTFTCVGLHVVNF